MIKIAEEFIWSNLKGQHFLDDGTFISFSNTNGYFDYHDIDFVVNKEKQTVVALIKYTGGKVIKRGIAKCMPGDVFNEWIGKAIALAKALEIDIPVEFLEAVQPSDYAVGQIVQRHDEPIDSNIKYLVDRIGEGETLTKLWEKGKADCTTTLPLNFRNEGIRALKVIDDTNAIYRVGE